MINPEPQSIVRFGGNDAPHCSLEQAQAVILPLPYQATVCYGKGTEQAPNAILQASSQLEMYDQELDCVLPKLFTLAPLNLAGQAPEQVPQKVRPVAVDILKRGKLLCSLGGEHSVSLGAFQACQQVCPEPFSILQLDAHTDLRASYQGSPYSHACIMYQAYQLGIPFVQVGTRTISAAEKNFLHSNKLENRVFWAEQLCGLTPKQNWLPALLALLESHVYISLDVDVLDPSCMPATGTPEPGGLNWYFLLNLLRAICQHKKIIAMDVVEFSPLPPMHAPDYTVAKLVYKMLNYALLAKAKI